ncbi:unnamed protein product [Cunninghamella blakesleeana]
MNYQNHTLNSILPWTHINNNPTPTTANENDTKRRRTGINQSTDINVNPNTSLPSLTHIYNKYVPVSTTNSTFKSIQSPTTTQWQGQQLNRSQSLSGLSTMSTPTIIPQEDYSQDQLPMQTSLIDLTLEEKPNTLINHTSQSYQYQPLLPYSQQQQPNQKSYHRPHSESSVFSHHSSKYNPPTSYSNTSSPVLNHHRRPMTYVNDFQTIHDSNINNNTNHTITRPHSTSGIKQYSNNLPFNGIVTQPSVVKHQQHHHHHHHHQHQHHHHHLHKEQHINQLQQQPTIIPDKQENKEIINNNNNNSTNKNNGQMYNNHQHNNDININNINNDNNNNNNVNLQGLRMGSETKYDICLGMLRSDVVTKSPLNLVKDELYEPVEMRFEGCRESNYTFTITSKKTGNFFGWVPFTDTRVLGPLTSYKLVIWDVVIPRNKANHSRTPLYIILYCQQSAYESICNILSIHKVELKDPPFYNPACQYLNPKFGKQNEESTTNSLRKATSLPSTPYPHYEYNNYDSSSYMLNMEGSSSNNQHSSLNTLSTQSKQQIAQLLESIPTSLKKRNNNNNNNDMADDHGDHDEIKEEDLNMEGLTIKLLPHQVEGIRWMMNREENEVSSGGILADDMGLGKTIQTIGLVVSGLLKEKKKNKNNKTLIVAPLALINQWASEFKTKTIENGIKVLIHHGSQRTQNHTDFEMYDVVITTYQMVASDIPSVSTKKRKKQQTIVISDGEDEDMLETSEGDTSTESSRVTSPKLIQDQPSNNNNNNDDDDNHTNEFNPEYGPLFQLKWHRVVLDEAQQIKNHTTRVSIACSRLLANKRWCLTGTPIQNRVEELYSLFRFLKIKPLCQLHEFRKAISIPIQRGQMEQALDRLKLVLMAIMLRRTKAILGSESTSFMNDTSSSSSLSSPSSSSSTFTTISSSLPSNDIRITTETSSTITSTIASSSKSQSLNISLPKRQKQDILLPFAPSERTLYNLLTEKTTNAVRKLINSGKGTKSFMNMLCMVLRLRQACNHPQLVLRSLSNDTDLFSLSENGMIQSSSSSKPRSSKRENSEIALQKVVMSQMASDLGWNNDQVKDQSSNTLCEICRSPIIMIDIDETNEVQYCSDCLHQLECIHVASQTTSTKINKMLDILQETQQHFPDEKTIIFSQFTSMLDLMEKPLKEKKIKFCRYDGSMSNIAREKSLHALRTDPDCKVMLISLKCGSLGLNLTAANRVILMDIWWNPAVEEQAIDRVHRIGQSLPVHVTRLIIKDTIEQKIIMLQQKKAMLVKGALGDQMINNTKLTYRELLSLFDIER